MLTKDLQYTLMVSLDVILSTLRSIDVDKKSSDRTSTMTFYLTKGERRIELAFESYF
jgi:hypothetical protein